MLVYLFVFIFAVALVSCSCICCFSFIFGVVVKPDFVWYVYLLITFFCCCLFLVLQPTISIYYIQILYSQPGSQSFPQEPEIQGNAKKRKKRQTLLKLAKKKSIKRSKNLMHSKLQISV